MDFVVTAVIVALVIAAPLLVLTWYQRRLRRRLEPAIASGTPAEIGWPDVQPVDRLIWAEQSAAVEVTVRCREERDHRVFGWLWYLVSGGGLVEYRAGRVSVFGPPDILEPDSEQFEAISGPRGVLAAFESRSRLSWEPAGFVWNGETYSVSGTGAFQAWIHGDVTERAVWSNLGKRQSDNVYFALQRDSADEEAAETAGDLLLGIWTDAISLHPLSQRLPADAIRIVRPDENLAGEKS